MAFKREYQPKSEKLQKAWKFLDDFLDNLDDFLDNLGKPIKFDQYLELTEKYIDNKIIKECKEKKLICIGGKCRISASKVIDDKENPIILCNVDLFFQNIQKQWVKSSISGKTPFSKFDLEDPQTAQNLKKLVDGAIKENEIEPPESK